MKHLSFRLLLVLLSFGMLFSACHHKNEDDPVPPVWPESQHTLLIYMIGDNSLSSYCRENTNACIDGMLKTETPVNLVIYEDSRASGYRGTPVLFRLKRNAIDKQKVDTIMIRQYETDFNSSDPEMFKQVVNEAFEAAPASVKGIEMWSHGLGWAPGATYKATRAQGAAATRAQQYIGIDGNDYMEIWQMREALEGCPHIDYLLFDACNMGQIEVAYELRNVADYMLACPTEIMAEGLPYSPLIQSLSTCHNKASVVDALKRVVDDFKTRYPGKQLDQFHTIIDGGTFALTDLRQLTTVHNAYKSFLADCADRLQLIENHPYTYEDSFQHYGRSAQGTSHVFFDIMTVAEFIGDNRNLYSYQQFKTALEKAIIKEYHSEYFLDFYFEMNSCGLGVSLPELFQLATNRNTLRSAYNELQWAKD